jgi:hypothetical protein
MNHSASQRITQLQYLSALQHFSRSACQLLAVRARLAAHEEPPFAAVGFDARGGALERLPEMLTS